MSIYKNISICLGSVLLVAVMIGCGGAGAKGKGTTDKAKAGPDSIVSADGTVISKKAKEDFDKAAEKYKAAKKTGWTDAMCTEVAGAFQKVADKNDGMLEAVYNVGVVNRKCGKNDEAKAIFKSIVKSVPDHQYALTHLAVYELEEGNENAGQDYLRKAVKGGMNKLEVVPALVNAATISRKKGRSGKGNDEVFKKAEKNLRRALAIDSNYMPALYQLALLYYDRAIAKKKPSFLTLSSLVCLQASRIDPEFGSIYHMMGQISLAKNELVQALTEFQRAFEKDQTLFASYMNFAAINLNFRGYEEAKAAFEKALGLQPKSYDAHIGLGVALRGLNDFAGARAEYKKASEINPKRTDYIFNVGVLEMDYENTGDVPGFEKAKKVFIKFTKNLTKEQEKDPDGRGPLKSWEQKAKDRIALCDKNIQLLKDVEKELEDMKRLEEENKKKAKEQEELQRLAKELAAKEEAGEQAPGEGVEGDTDAEGDPAPKAEEPKAEEPKAEEPKAEVKKEK